MDQWLGKLHVKLEKKLHQTYHNKRPSNSYERLTTYLTLLNLRKIDNIFDSLKLRGNSFNRRQIRTKKEFLKTSVLLKGTSSVKWSTFLSASGCHYLYWPQFRRTCVWAYSQCQ